MKRFLGLSAVMVAAVAGVLAPAAAAQADTRTTTATADYVCESLQWTVHIGVTSFVIGVYGTNCTGPADLPQPGQTVTAPDAFVSQGDTVPAIWTCNRWDHDEEGRLEGLNCYVVG